MLTSITKYSKSFFIKLLVAIIILPFIFWGMGDVFRGGNQNIIATIDSKKISTQEFINYLNRVNLTEEESKNLGKSNLVEEILSDFIGRKIIELEVEKLGIVVSDKSLKNIIVNNSLFEKNGKFSRTKYEKFLLENGYSANVFENNLLENEKKTQLLDFLSRGIIAPKLVVEKFYNNENQTKKIKYIDLNKIFEKQVLKEEEVKSLYNKNKQFLTEEYKKIKFAELKSENLIGTKEYDENYFKIIDKIENNIIDGLEFENVIKKYELKVSNTNELNLNMMNNSGKKNSDIEKELFDKFFKIKRIKSPEIISFKDKYYIAEVISNNKIAKKFNDVDVQNLLKSQLKTQNKFEYNKKLIQKISNKTFDLNSMKEFATDNKLNIIDKSINGIKDNEIFSEEILKEVFRLKDNSIGLITSRSLKKNYIVFSEKTINKNLSLSSEKFKEYETKAKLALAQNIYRTYDKSVNSRYKVDINNKVINRLKNSF